MVKISFLACDGCIFSGVSGLIDSFLIANLWHAAGRPPGSAPLFETEILSPDGAPVMVSGGYKITTDGDLGGAAEADLVILPPFLPNAEFLAETSNDIIDWLVESHSRGVEIAALCTGAFMLAETGLLNGRLATTNWYFAGLFRSRHPRVNLKPKRILTEDQGLICTGSASAYYNLGLFLMEKYGSPTLASQCSKALLVDSNRTNQAAYAIFNAYKDHGDNEILRAQQWLEDHYSENISMENLAGRVGVSPRHFIRRFKKAAGDSPLNYLQQLRIEKAKRMLETTSDTVNEITQAIGYENSSTFRKLFKEYTKLSPREYRTKFARALRAPKK